MTDVSGTGDPVVDLARRPAAPPWFDGLALEQRGFYVPAETPWGEDGPRLSMVGTEWKLGAGFPRCCAVCGWGLVPGRRVYRAFAQSDAAQIRLYETELASDVSGPGHLSCMVYSALVCPYLKAPTARLGKASQVAPGARRGKLAAILGFADVGVMFARGREVNDPQAPPMFAYRTLAEDIRFRAGSELLDRYEAALADDAGHVDRSGTRAYFPYVYEESTELHQVLKAGFRTLGTRPPDFEMKVGVTHYEGVGLPVAA